MVVIAKGALVAFAKEYPDALVSLMEWYDNVTQADWNSVNDVRSMYNTADYIGNERFVFNIRGNRYRLIVAVVFSIRTVYIKFIGTHAAYDKVDAKTVAYQP